MLSDTDPIQPHEIREMPDEAILNLAKLLANRVLVDALSRTVDDVDDIDPEVRAQERAIRDAIIAEAQRRGWRSASAIVRVLKLL